MKKVQTYERGQVWYVSETVGKSTLSSYFTNDFDTNHDRKNINVSIYDKMNQNKNNSNDVFETQNQSQSQNQQYDGSIQGKSRPYLIVSNDACNESSPVITVVPFTSKDKKYLPTHVYVNLYGHKQTILCEQVRAFNKKNLETNGSYFISKIPDYIMKKVDRCLAIQLGLNVLDMAQNEIKQTQYQVETLSKLTKTMVQQNNSVELSSEKQVDKSNINNSNVDDSNNNNLNINNSNNNVEIKKSDSSKKKSYLFQTRWSDEDKLKFVEQCKNHTLLEMSKMYDINISTVSKYKSSFKKELANK